MMFRALLFVSLCALAGCQTPSDNSDPRLQKRDTVQVHGEAGASYGQTVH